MEDDEGLWHYNRELRASFTRPNAAALAHHQNAIFSLPAANAIASALSFTCDHASASLSTTPPSTIHKTHDSLSQCRASSARRQRPSSMSLQSHNCPPRPRKHSRICGTCGSLRVSCSTFFSSAMSSRSTRTLISRYEAAIQTSSTDGAEAMAFAVDQADTSFVQDLEHECLLPHPSEKLAQIGLALLKVVSSHRGLT